MIKNKKADVAVTLLVFLVMFVASTTLFVFVTNNKVTELKISDAIAIERVYTKENLVDFYLVKIIESVAVKTYIDFVEYKNENYIGSLLYNEEESTVYFQFLAVNWKEDFKKNFIENLKSEFKEQGYMNDYMSEIKNNALQDKVQSKFDGEILEITFPSLEINDSYKKINITYHKVPYSKINLTKIGLHSFDRIYEVKENCKDVDNIEMCFIQLNNFDVEVNKNNVVKLSSKNSFVVDSQIKNIEFSFIPK